MQARESRCLVGKTDLHWDRLQTSEEGSESCWYRARMEDICEAALPEPQDDGETYTAQRAAVLGEMVGVHVQAVPVGTCLFRHRWDHPTTSAQIHLTAVDSYFSNRPDGVREKNSTMRLVIYPPACSPLSRRTHSTVRHPQQRTSCRQFPIGRWSETQERDRGRSRQSSGEQGFEGLSKRMFQLASLIEQLMWMSDALFGVFGSRQPAPL